MNTNEIAIKVINEKLHDLRSVHDATSFITWQKITISTLKRVIPHNVSIFDNLESIDPIANYTATDVSHNAKAQSKTFLEHLIKDIERFGLEEEPAQSINNSGVAVHVQQVNDQKQTTNVSISIDILFNVLKEELRATEIKELKEILDSEQEPKEKKKSFINKIKSFGSDVASNILANILTNPAVYDTLGKML